MAETKINPDANILPPRRESAHIAIIAPDGISNIPKTRKVSKIFSIIVFSFFILFLINC